MKMKKIKCLRFLMMIQVEFLHSRMHQSNLSKEIWFQIWPTPRKAQAKNTSGSNMVPGRRLGKEKKQKKKKIAPNRMIQQFLKLSTNIFKKSQQFSQKKYKKVKMRFLVTWLLQNWKAFPVLFWRLAFKWEVNNPATTQHLSAYNSLFSNYWCSIHTEH